MACVRFDLESFMSLKGCQFEVVDERLQEKLTACFQACAKEMKDVTPYHHSKTTQYKNGKHAAVRHSGGGGGGGGHHHHKQRQPRAPSSQPPHAAFAAVRPTLKPTTPLRTLLGVLNKCSDANFGKMTKAVLDITTSESITQHIKCIWDHACQQNAYHQQYTFMIQELYKQYPADVMAFICQEIHDFMKAEWLVVRRDQDEDYNEFCERLKTKNALMGRCKMILSVYASELGLHAASDTQSTVYPPLDAFIAWFLSKWTTAVLFDTMESLELSIEQYLMCVLYIVDHVPKDFLQGCTEVFKDMNCVWCIPSKKFETGDLPAKIKFKLLDICDRLKDIFASL